MYFRRVGFIIATSIAKNSFMAQIAYQRILLKLSGEALNGGDKTQVIDFNILEKYALEVKSAVDLGVQVAIVIGGGNIFRGASVENSGIDRVQGDHMGMLATVINGMAIQSALEKHGIITRLMSAINMEQVCEPLIRRRAIRHLEKGRVVIFGAGTGNPYFTTDTTAGLRAKEIEANVVLKGTRVDGVYDKDPEKDPTAVKYDSLTFDEAISKKLKVMDQTAFTLCHENELPIVVFDMNKPGNLYRLVTGEKVGTRIG